MLEQSEILSFFTFPRRYFQNNIEFWFKRELAIVYKYKILEVKENYTNTYT